MSVDFYHNPFNYDGESTTQVRDDLTKANSNFEYLFNCCQSVDNTIPSIVKKTDNIQQKLTDIENRLKDIVDNKLTPCNNIRSFLSVVNDRYIIDNFRDFTPVVIGDELIYLYVTTYNTNIEENVQFFDVNTKQLTTYTGVVDWQPIINQYNRKYPPYVSDYSFHTIPVINTNKTTVIVSNRGGYQIRMIPGSKVVNSSSLGRNIYTPENSSFKVQIMFNRTSGIRRDVRTTRVDDLSSSFNPFFTYTEQKVVVNNTGISTEQLTEQINQPIPERGGCIIYANIPMLPSHGRYNIFYRTVFNKFGKFYIIMVTGFTEFVDGTITTISSITYDTYPMTSIFLGDNHTCIVERLQ